MCDTDVTSYLYVMFINLCSNYFNEFRCLFVFCCFVMVHVVMQDGWNACCVVSVMNSIGCDVVVTYMCGAV